MPSPRVPEAGGIGLKVSLATSLHFMLDGVGSPVDWSAYGYN